MNISTRKNSKNLKLKPPEKSERLILKTSLPHEKKEEAAITSNDLDDLLEYAID